MPIQFTSKTEGDILIFTASGNDDNLEEVLRYSTALIEEAQNSGLKKILCDERNLEYEISTMDTYKLAENAASQLTEVSAWIAIVYKPEYFEKCKFYETVASNRGMIVFVTTSYDEALEWLKKH